MRKSLVGYSYKCYRMPKVAQTRLQLPFRIEIPLAALIRQTTELSICLTLCASAQIPFSPFVWSASAAQSHFGRTQHVSQLGKPDIARLSIEIYEYGAGSKVIRGES